MSPPVAAYDGTALGSSLRIVVTAPGSLDEAVRAVTETLGRVDLALSRFRDDSEINRLNRAGGRSLPVSDLLWKGVEAGLRGARLSGGAVDPTVGRAMRVLGYDRTFGQVLRDGEPIALEARSVPGWLLVEMNASRRTVRIPAGVELDLGATGKGLAADLCAGAGLRALPPRSGILVSLGGDIALAGVPPPEGWVIQVAESSDAELDQAAEKVALGSGAIATSSTSVRRWSRGSVGLHHILDPATSLPVAGPWRSVSVIAADCVDANTGSTAAIVKGATAVEWLESAGLAARLVDHEGRAQRVGGWAQPPA